ncbi:hypothetical protein LUX01_23645 [Streptomyces sudanensis]|uniref:hypothetical protein n=1 Tax=Streptomyces sudanensis TaxID=436397 RepID=UPI0020CF4376|nr:hypothetical protein [Streptomyces sudanensis]MCP9989185.1 hypothetical protein [Streptomyces sudanensis]
MGAAPAGAVPLDEAVPDDAPYQVAEVEQLGERGDLGERLVVGVAEEPVEAQRLRCDDVLRQEVQRGRSGRDGAAVVREQPGPAVREFGEHTGAQAGRGGGEPGDERRQFVDAVRLGEVLGADGVPGAGRAEGAQPRGQAGQGVGVLGRDRIGGDEETDLGEALHEGGGGGEVPLPGLPGLLGFPGLPGLPASRAPRTGRGQGGGEHPGQLVERGGGAGAVGEQAEGAAEGHLHLVLVGDEVASPGEDGPVARTWRGRRRPGRC